MDHGDGGPELVGDAGAGEAIADQRGEEVRDGKDLKLGDNLKQLTPTRISMLRSKIALALMTSSKAFLVMIILLTYSGMMVSSKENFENQDFVGTNVTGDVNLAQNQDSGMMVSSEEDFEMHTFLWSDDFSCFLGDFDTNENMGSEEFGRDINRNAYFSVTPFDPIYGDDNNISGIANQGDGGGGGGRIPVPISSNTMDPGILVSQTSDHERVNIDERASDITLQVPAIGISSTTVSSGGDDGRDGGGEAVIQRFGQENDGGGDGGGGGGGEEGGCMVGEGWWEMWWLLLALWKLI